MVIKPTVLLITGQQTKFVKSLEKKYQLVMAHSGKQAVDLIAGHGLSLIILDAVSMRTTGDRICKTLQGFGVPIVHIHPGPRGTMNCQAEVTLFAPCTPRRLLNSVGRIIRADDEEELRCGPFRMNIPRRILVAHGEETHLTPKQALLVELFLRNPGRTLARKIIMEQVWHTDYLGDTRTLDVHIRWLRQIMEKSSTKPRYIKTVRGVGYKLVV